MHQIFFNKIIQVSVQDIDVADAVLGTTQTELPGHRHAAADRRRHPKVAVLLVHRELVQDMPRDFSLCNIGNVTGMNGNFIQNGGFLVAG